MVDFTTFEVKNKKSGQESLRVNMPEGKITGNFSAFKFIDKETRQTIIYLPSLEVSGYGDNFEEANEMIRFSIQDFLGHLITLPSTNFQKELSKLGWHQGIFNKEYSRDYVDIKENLGNFNIDENSIETLTLTAA